MGYILIALGFIAFVLGAGEAGLGDVISLTENPRFDGGMLITAAFILFIVGFALVVASENARLDHSKNKKRVT